MADERYTLTDVEALAAHLRPTIDRQLGDHTNRLSPTQIADAALTWAIDHGWTRTAPPGADLSGRGICPACNHPRPVLHNGRMGFHLFRSDGTAHPCPGEGQQPTAVVEATNAPEGAPYLPGFVRRAGIDVSDIDGSGDEAAVALGHHDEREVRAAFGTHARFCWGAEHSGGAGPIRSAWVTATEGALDPTDWRLYPAAEDDPGAFPVTYWEPR